MKQYLTLLLTTLGLNAAMAQHSGNIEGNTLWLKADTVSIKKIKDPELLNATHFNFNPVVDKQGFKKPFKNIIAERYSLFAVFKSDFEEERGIITLQRGSTKTLFTNKMVANGKDALYEGNVSKGIIVSYLNGDNDKNGRKKNTLSIDDVFAEDEQGREQLMELIYYPKMLSKPERQRIETYLSIKYGISIEGDFDYTDSKGNKIWGFQENETYKNHVTGIGRDDTYGLYQKQSGNSLKDGVYLGLGIVDTTNTHNKYILRDRAFLLWGDNGGKTLLSLEKNARLKKMERIWKMNLSGIIQQDSITTQIRINKDEFAYINKEQNAEFLWLAINTVDYPDFNYTDAKYIRQSSEDDKFIYFDDIAWDTDGSGADIFTFIKGPDFMVENDSDFACDTNTGLVSVKFIGGTPPYNLNFNGEEIVTSDDLVRFDSLEPIIYSMKATESKGSSISANIELTPFEETSLTLLPVWYLGEQREILVAPVVNAGNPVNLSYEWARNGARISTGKEFLAVEPGDYTLRVSNAEGCEKIIPFRVEGQSSGLSYGWKMYPNPVRSGEPFTVAFSLEKETEATITVNSMEGKQMLFRNLGVIKEYTFQESIIISGVYMVTIQTGDTSETIKLIVQ